MQKEKTKLQKYMYTFDKYTSKNETDWFLALIWIFIIELFSSILEFEFLDVSQDYIIYLEDGIYKEIIISLFIVLFIWAIIYNIVFMRRSVFYNVAMYISFCIYLVITHDINLNLLIHNLNPAEAFIDGFGFYMVVQVILKIVIAYLIYKMLLSIKNRKK